ncbi:MAG: DUF805 domain-containing protein [Pseudomonadota bacterium]
MPYLFNPFHGQISRGTWWLSQLVIFALAVAGLFVSAAFLADPGAPKGARNDAEVAMFAVVFVAMIYLNFSTCLNRLRDTGRSGFWYLAFFMPYAGTGLMIYFCGIEAGQGGDPIARDPRPSRTSHAFEPVRPSPPAQKPRQRFGAQGHAFGRR